MVAKDFKEKVLPVNNKILRFASQFLNDPDEAKDVVQDVLLKLWQKRKTLRQIKNMEAFAMQMTRNQCLDKIRGKKTASLNEKDERRVNEETIDNSQSKLEISESVRIIRDLINILPPLQRDIMHLRDMEQYTYEEIAEITELKINAVRVNLSRARKKVRDGFIKIQNNEKQRSKNIGSKIL